MSETVVEAPGKLAAIRAFLKSITPKRVRTDGTPSRVCVASYDGRAITFGPATEATIRAASRTLDQVEKAIAGGRASEAAESALELSQLLYQLQSDNVTKPLLAGLATMRGGVKGSAKTNRDHKRPTRTQAEAKVAKRQQQPDIGKTKAKELAAADLGIGKSTLYAILKE